MERSGKMGSEMGEKREILGKKMGKKGEKRPKWEKMDGIGENCSKWGEMAQNGENGVRNG